MRTVTPGDLISYTFSPGGHCRSVRHVLRETQCQLGSAGEHTRAQQRAGLTSSIQKSKEGRKECDGAASAGGRGFADETNRHRLVCAYNKLERKDQNQQRTGPALENSRQNDGTELVLKNSKSLPPATPRGWDSRQRNVAETRTATEHSPQKKRKKKKKTDDKLLTAR